MSLLGEGSVLVSHSMLLPLPLRPLMPLNRGVPATPREHSADTRIGSTAMLKRRPGEGTKGEGNQNRLEGRSVKTQPALHDSSDHFC